MKSRAAVIQFIKAGALPKEGYRLFAVIYGTNHPFLKLARHLTPITHAILVNTLARQHNIKLAVTPSAPSVISSGAAQKPRSLGVSELTSKPSPQKFSFREKFPFLSNPDCPQELKVLATDSITTYHNYVAAHAALFDATTKEEEFEAVKTCVENYIENRQIFREFDYYNKHKAVLGLHPIFKQFNELAKLRKLLPVELPIKQKKLEHNIWRIESQLKNKKEKHLTVAREKSLQSKKAQLQEVKRLIENYKK
ncbi:hypothetical protein [Roseivirga seohaensis]|uniref:hypothetical protein n=1 Tax=Roseivirga seohaensis TaxID=1914963 RepID=UPI003BA9790B